MTRDAPQEPEISIAGGRIGPGHPVYVIAEVSANHGQDFETAVRERLPILSILLNNSAMAI